MCRNSPLFFNPNDILLYVETTIYSSIHLLMDMGYFHLLVIMNNASTMGIQIFESLLLLLFGIYISRSRIVGFYGNVYVEFF